MKAPLVGTSPTAIRSSAAVRAEEGGAFATQLHNVATKDSEEHAVPEETEEEWASGDQPAAAVIEIDTRAVALAIVLGERSELTPPPELGGNAMVATENAPGAATASEGTPVNISVRSAAPAARSTDMSTGSEETPVNISARSAAPAARSTDMSTGSEGTLVTPTSTQMDEVRERAPQRAEAPVSPSVQAPLPFSPHVDPQSVQPQAAPVDALAHMRATTSADTTPVSLLTVRHATHAEIHDAELGTIRVDAETKHGKVELAVKTTQIDTAIALQAIEPVLRADMQKDAIPFGSYRVDVETSGGAQGQHSSQLSQDGRHHAFTRGESQDTPREGEAPTSVTRHVRGGRVRIVL